jgi:hypothetical protein
MSRKRRKDMGGGIPPLNERVKIESGLQRDSFQKVCQHSVSQRQPESSRPIQYVTIMFPLHFLTPVGIGRRAGSDGIICLLIALNVLGYS